MILKVDHGAAAAHPGTFHNASSQPCSRPTESDCLGEMFNNLCSNKPSTWSLMLIQFGNHYFRPNLTSLTARVDASSGQWNKRGSPLRVIVGKVSFLIKRTDEAGAAHFPSSYHECWWTLWPRGKRSEGREIQQVEDGRSEISKSWGSW